MYKHISGIDMANNDSEPSWKIAGLAVAFTGIISLLSSRKREKVKPLMLEKKNLETLKVEPLMKDEE